MTKRTPKIGLYSRLELTQYRLRIIADDLENGRPLHPKTLDFLVEALWKIGKGADANEALQVKAKRGERKTEKEKARRLRMMLALSWIASVIRTPEEGGDGMTLEEAIADAAEYRSGETSFGLSEDSLRTYWSQYPELRSPSILRPIETLPVRKKKDR
jgi:hypothetical protein